MTLEELYAGIGGDYEQVIRIMRMDKLIDKHIRKFEKNALAQNVLQASESMDPIQLFESAHAMKGVCANLGLTRLSETAAELADEFRPGTARRWTDEQVRAKIQSLVDLSEDTVKKIQEYIQENNQ